MLRLRRRCAQTARISLHSINVKERGHKNNGTANPLARPAALPPEFLAAASAAGPLVPSAFQRLVRFGEGVFTSGVRGLQEENSGFVTIFCRPAPQALLFLVIFLSSRPIICGLRFGPQAAPPPSSVDNSSESSGLMGDPPPRDGQGDSR